MEVSILLGMALRGFRVAFGDTIAPNNYRVRLYNRLGLWGIILFKECNLARSTYRSTLCCKGHLRCLHQCLREVPEVGAEFLDMQ